MVFQGDVLPIGAMLEHARTAPAYEPATDVGVRHTAAENARYCQDLLAKGDSLDACWRFGILQTLDDYSSPLRRGGVTLAATVFSEEPPRTGAAQVDAAFAALADYLAERDGWDAPSWVQDPTRRTTAWYPAVPKYSGPRQTDRVRTRSDSAGSLSPGGHWPGHEQTPRGTQTTRTTWCVAGGASLGPAA